MADTKLFQTKIDRQLANDFKIACIEMGSTQKDVLEEWIPIILSVWEDTKNGEECVMRFEPLDAE